MRFQLKILGCDNDRGVFERGGDLDVEQVTCAPDELGDVVLAVTGSEMYCGRNSNRPTITRVRDDLYLVSYTEEGCAVVVAAEKLCR